MLLKSFRLLKEGRLGELSMNEKIDDRDAKIMNKLNVVDSLVKGSKNA